MNIHLKCPGCKNELWILSTLHAEIKCGKCNYGMVRFIDDSVHVTTKRNKSKSKGLNSS